MADKYESTPLDEWLAELHTPLELVMLDIKGMLLTIINSKISDTGLNQTEAAKKLGVDQARISRLMCLQYTKFSIDALIEFAHKLGCDIKVDRPECNSISIK